MLITARGAFIRCGAVRAVAELRGLSGGHGPTKKIEPMHRK